jgi:hypothetical protein
VQIDIRERLVIRADGCLKQPLPKATALVPACLQVSGLLHGDAINLRGSHLGDSGRERGRHTEDEIKRARHGAADRQGGQQDLANERHRARGVRRVRAFREQNIGTSLARALPPLWALKVQIDEEDRAPPRPLTDPVVHLRPQGRESCVVVGLFGQEGEVTRVQLAHCSQGILARPTLRRGRRAQDFLLLSHGRIVSLMWERIFHPPAWLTLSGFAVFAVKH